MRSLYVIHPQMSNEARKPTSLLKEVVVHFVTCGPGTIHFRVRLVGQPYTQLT